MLLHRNKSKDLLILARFIIDLRTVNFILNSTRTHYIQFYNIYTNNLLYNVCKILLKAEQYKKKVRIKINKINSKT